jgi:hypothetical protein
MPPTVVHVYREPMPTQTEQLCANHVHRGSIVVVVNTHAQNAQLVHHSKLKEAVHATHVNVVNIQIRLDKPNACNVMLVHMQM